ncbi:phosphate ABC transporter substrate-binding protein PstS [Actinoplanes teichomyceticus]|uniref:Phosphate-binding protein n=1 Tax=Actinoplanes teichomyceticus TaxID=1867 RepID=A0A561WA73_ACTTI|nr:phosphate ABC transporter substrate-binding protein PstS [Actinoplanes teichomyceticus]TWG20753.1 phosphate ABC transporter substrate-binding protein (PhoT family) [Actinoplanes teichomyceticus]GIF14409.1 phosphate-binding protein PstS [Actinoplanes teichomyceticus]
MKKLRAAALAALLLLSACDEPVASAEPVPCASGEARGQGSSAQASALNEWIRQYQIACSQAAVAYASSGSGAGVRAFLAGTGDFAGTDAPLNDADRAAAATRCGGEPAVHLPLVIGPIALAHNVAGVGELRLRPATIAKIFSGRITSWNDRAIAADNPDTVLPATPIRTVHREDSSGTTANFTRFLADAARADWPFPAASDWPAPGGLARAGSDRLASAITRTDGAIGYVEASYARVNELATALIGDAYDDFVPPTDEAAAAAVAAATVAGADDLRLTIAYPRLRSGAYPLVQVTYEVVCRTGASEVARGFLTYAASRAGQAAAQRAGYAPLPDTLRNRVHAAAADLR